MIKTETDKKVLTNKSKTYLLPLLSKDIDIKFNYLLVNTFIKFNKDIGNINYPIGLLYTIEDSSEFLEYNDYLIKNHLYYNNYNVENNNKLYIFDFPKEFINDYLSFKNGMYSKFSTNAKSLIISYSAATYMYPPLIEDITGVLWKHKTRREKLEKLLNINLPPDSELASKIDYNKETFNF